MNYNSLRSRRLLLAFALIIISLFPACQKGSSSNSNKVVIAIANDLESYNPLYAMNINEGIVSTILYPRLVRHTWNYELGKMNDLPMLAEKWDWNRDSSSITIYLRKDAQWTDGKPVTANDVVFSFDLFSDPVVQSRFYGEFKNFYTDSSQHIILSKTFEIKNPFELVINFKKNANASLYDIDYPVLPEHIYKNIDRKNLVTAEKDLKPVSSGSYILERWDKNQAIFLKANKKSFLYKDGMIDEIILKIIPDYNSRLTQLKNGEVDFVQDVKADDVPSLLKDKSLKLAAIKGRNYDYIGWNNIDPAVYAKTKKYVLNKLFADPLVRKALAYALNRKEVVEQFLNGNGAPAVGPIAPIFKQSIDTALSPYPYDPEKAKELLAKAGWKDMNSEGILSKGGQKFSFTLYIPSGNPLREFAASVFKNNLHAVGIDMKVEPLEPRVFFGRMYKKEFDAWMAGWTVGIPILIKPLWYSTVPGGEFNVVTYRNKLVDNIIDKIDASRSEDEKNTLYKKFQQIMYDDEPTAFLYWIDNIVVYNKRIQNADISPLGAIENCWEWRITQE